MCILFNPIKMTANFPKFMIGFLYKKKTQNQKSYAVLIRFHQIDPKVSYGFISPPHMITIGAFCLGLKVISNTLLDRGALTRYQHRNTMRTLLAIFSLINLCKLSVEFPGNSFIDLFIQYCLCTLSQLHVIAIRRCTCFVEHA